MASHGPSGAALMSIVIGSAITTGAVLAYVLYQVWFGG